MGHIYKRFTLKKKYMYVSLSSNYLVVFPGHRTPLYHVGAH